VTEEYGIYVFGDGTPTITDGQLVMLDGRLYRAALIYKAVIEESEDDRRLVGDGDWGAHYRVRLDAVDEVA
jgi:hypothetical protein